MSGKGPSWKDPNCGRPDLPDYCNCRKPSTMRELMMAALSLTAHPKMVDEMAGIDKCGPISSATNVINPWAECLFRFGKDCTKTQRKARPKMKRVFNALEKVHQNLSYRSWIISLPFREETEPSFLSVEEFDKSKSKHLM